MARLFTSSASLRRQRPGAAGRGNGAGSPAKLRGWPGFFIILFSCTLVLTILAGTALSQRNTLYRAIDGPDGSTTLRTEDGQVVWTFNPSTLPGDSGERFFSFDTLVLRQSLGFVGDIATAGQLSLADIDHDGATDLAFSVYPDSTWILEDNDAGLEVVRRYPSPMAGPSEAYLLAVGDGDGDRRNEMVFSSGGVPSEILFYESPTPTSYPDSVTFQLEQHDISPLYMQLTDMDRDLRREYIASTQGSSNNSVVIWETNGNNSFHKVYGEHFDVTGQLAIGDFDGDSRMDLVIPSNNSSSHTYKVHVLECGSNDSYSDVWSADVPTENMYWTCPGPDLDRDGRGDFCVMGGTGGPDVSWLVTMYEAIGDNTYAPVWSTRIYSGWIEGGIASGDIDNDGFNELLVQVPDRTLIFRAAGNNDLRISWIHYGNNFGQGHHRILGTDLDRDGLREAVWWAYDVPYQLVVYERVNGLSSVDDGVASLSDVSISPNPVRRSCWISWDAPAGAGSYCQILDSSGRRVGMAEGRVVGSRRTARWTPGGQAEGVYFFQIPTAGTPIVGRFVVLR